MSDLLAHCSVTIERHVCWGEMDAFSHVNNTVYFRYFEDARIAYFEKADVLDIMKKTGIGPILASTHCRFRIPLSYPDTVTIGARVSRLQKDRFTMSYQVASQAKGKLAADGEGTLVAFDYNKNVKAIVPDQLAARIAELEGDTLERA